MRNKTTCTTLPTARALKLLVAPRVVDNCLSFRRPCLPWLQLVCWPGCAFGNSAAAQRCILARVVPNVADRETVPAVQKDAGRVATVDDVVVHAQVRGTVRVDHTISVPVMLQPVASDGAAPHVGLCVDAPAIGKVGEHAVDTVVDDGIAARKRQLAPANFLKTTRLSNAMHIGFRRLWDCLC